MSTRFWVRVGVLAASLSVLAGSLLSVGSVAAATTAAAGATQTFQAAPVVPHGAVATGQRPANEPLRLSVFLKPADPVALNEFALAVSTPGSALYHHYLARGQFAGRFGPTPATVAHVVAALRRMGLHPAAISRNHLEIPIVTTTAGAERAFDVQLHSFRLADDHVVYANTRAPRLPTSIAGQIQAVLGLDDVTQLVAADPPAHPTTPTRSSGSSVISAGDAAGPSPCPAATETGGATAATLASAYRFDGLYTKGDLGTGVTVALLELSDYNDTDIATFETCYGIDTTVTRELVDGGAPYVAGVTTPSETLEVEGDIEDVIGLAPDIHVVSYEAPCCSLNSIVDDTNQIVSDDTAQVMSTSWGFCESASDDAASQSENVLFEQAATQGQTVLAASGDSGSECYYRDDSSDTALSVDDPASQPFVTGVGGTVIELDGPPPTEATWNVHEQTGASGGGISSLWPMPSWQSGPGVDNSYTSGTPCGASGGDCREVPDVSALAGSPFYAGYCAGNACDNFGWGTGEGTSFATPLWAALVALADETCAPATTVGFLNPTLYQLASAGRGDFNDVTVGNNDDSGTNGGAYPATPGYDMATGLGTPNGTRLAGDLCPNEAPAVTSVDSATASTGQSFRFNVTTTGHPTPAITESTGTGQAGLPAGVTFVDNSDGTATISGTPTTIGTSTFTITVDDGVSPDATQTFTLTVQGSVPPATITSVGDTTAVKGQPLSFKITTSGTPTPSIATSTKLPKGITLTDNGNGTATLAGTPKKPGVTAITIEATNVNGTTSQTFSLTVASKAETPKFTSPASATVDAGTPFNFSVLTTAAPSSTITAASLPSWLTLTNNQDGTGALSAHDPLVGTYSFGLTATNSAGSAQQSFTLTVTAVAPVITSASSATVAKNQPVSVTVTTTGGPIPAITGTGLPSWLKLTDNHDGTASLEAAKAKKGTYSFTITATNSVGSTSQSFTLTVT